MCDYILLTWVWRAEPRIVYGTEVRQWRTTELDSFPVVASHRKVQGESTHTLNLLPPKFLSLFVQQRMGPNQFADRLDIYELEHSRADRCLAHFNFPHYSRPPTEPYIVCGAMVAPGEQGVCWIAAAGSAVSDLRLAPHCLVRTADADT